MTAAHHTRGPRERHLARRAGNPLFAAARREVAEAEWRAAREADAAARAEFMTRFQGLVQEAAALSSNEESEVVLALKARLDQAYAEACALGGLDQVKAGLGRLIDAIMGAVRRGAAGDLRAITELDDEALAREQQMRLLEHPLVADLMLPDSPVPAAELLATLLSADADGLEAALWLFDMEATADLAAEARALLAAVPDAPPDAHARLRQLEQAAPVN